MEDLQNKKDDTIIRIYKSIEERFGLNYFQHVDFWNADLFAIGLKKGSKLIYISTWDFKSLSIGNMKYYLEFEIVDEISSQTKRTYKTYSGVTQEILLHEINLFLNLD